MRDALRFEWVRLRTLRSTYWLIGSGLLLNAGVALLVAYATRRDPLGVAVVNDVVTGGASLPLPLLAVFLAVVGIFATGHEYRYGTIQPTLTTVPQRTRLLAAKVLVVAGAALAVTAVSVALNIAAGMVYWDHLPDLTAAPLNAILPGYFLLMVLWTVAGAALGQLFRGVPAPLVVILMAPLVVEQLVLRLSFEIATWLRPVVPFLPFTAGQQLVSVAGEASGGDATEVDLFDRWVSGGVFAGSVALALAAALTLFKRRDA
jgi:ABC-2 type transport system permease protein